MISLVVTLVAAVNAGCSLIALAHHNWPVLIATICAAFWIGLLHILLVDIQ
jgi:hypothetical protein